MSLFEVPKSDARRRAEQVIDLNRAMRDFLRSRLARAMNVVWQAEDPQAVLDELHGLTESSGGAASLFQLAAQIQTVIETADATYERLTPPYFFEINADGTVTVGELIPPPPEDPDADEESR